MMGADEIHEAEVERFDPRQGGDLQRLAQRAGRFDQHVDGNLAGDAVALAGRIERGDLRQGVVGPF